MQGTPGRGPIPRFNFRGESSDDKEVGTSVLLRPFPNGFETSVSYSPSAQRLLQMIAISTPRFFSIRAQISISENNLVVFRLGTVITICVPKLAEILGMQLPTSP